MQRIEGNWAIKSLGSIDEPEVEVSFTFSVVRIIEIIGCGRKHSDEIFEMVRDALPLGWSAEMIDHFVKIYRKVPVSFGCVVDCLEQYDKEVQEYINKAIYTLIDDTLEFRARVERIAKSIFGSKFSRIDSWNKKYACRIYLNFGMSEMLFLRELEELHHELNIKHNNIFYNPIKQYLYVSNLGE